MDKLEETTVCGQVHNDILHRIESLVSLKLLTRSSAEVLDDRLTFKCLLEKQMVEKLARNVGIKHLDMYLIYI